MGRRGAWEAGLETLMGVDQRTGEVSKPRITDLVLTLVLTPA